ncbi:MAG: hypothetical protein JWM98_1182 [Thermoleophilia bacterium]|nr:hypothetical protein [Thermoleophilia bacterium]
MTACRSIRRTLPVAAAFLALAVAPSAQAAATLVSPAAAGVTVSRPIFSWTLPAGETSEYLNVSSQSVKDSDGRLSGSSKIYQATAALSYQDDSDLYAGTYFWQVESSVPDADGFKTHLYSPVAAFAVKAVASKPSQVWSRYTSINKFDLAVKWKGNVEKATVYSKLYLGKKLVYSKVDTEAYGSKDGYANNSYFYYANRSIREGTLLKSVVTVVAPGVKSSSIKYVKAP